MPHSRTPRSAVLPTPTDDALAHHQRLVERIRSEIVAAGGQITFARFMELALYAPGLGYYVAGQQKFGREGDFITAPELSPLFSRCLARQCQQIFAANVPRHILEFGAGSGVMAAHILTELETLGAPPERYEILELSAELQQRQRATIEQHAPHLANRVAWLSELPEPGWKGIILANEVLDAMPVHAVTFDASGNWERYVKLDGEEFAWDLGPLSNSALAAEATRVRDELGADWPEHYETEIGIAGQGWIRSLGTLLAEGAILAIDYGFPEHEYFHPDRAQGTLMCHYRHRAHTDPLTLAGLQDITAHVDFSSIANAAVSVGLHVDGFTSQAYFLLGCGLDKFLTKEQEKDDKAYFSATTQAKLLTLPSEMGELFKVIALTKNIDVSLMGFAAYDQRRRL